VEILHSGSDMTNPRTQQLIIAYTEHGHYFPMEACPNDVNGRHRLLEHARATVKNVVSLVLYIVRDDQPLQARRLAWRDGAVVEDQLTGDDIPVRVREEHAERWNSPPPA
jgi:hypothetical protein